MLFQNCEKKKKTCYFSASDLLFYLTPSFPSTITLVPYGRYFWSYNYSLEFVLPRQNLAEKNQ